MFQLVTLVMKFSLVLWDDCMSEHSFKYPYNDVSLNTLRINDKFIMYNKSLGKDREQIYMSIL